MIRGWGVLQERNKGKEAETTMLFRTSGMEERKLAHGTSMSFGVGGLGSCQARIKLIS